MAAGGGRLLHVNIRRQRVRVGMCMCECVRVCGALVLVGGLDCGRAFERGARNPPSLRTGEASGLRVALTCGMRIAVHGCGESHSIYNIALRTCLFGTSSIPFRR